MDKHRANAPDHWMKTTRPDPFPALSLKRQWMPAPRFAALAGAAVVLALVAILVVSMRAVLPEPVAILLFLSAVLINAVAFGFWVGIISAICALAGLNFLFLEPHFTLHVARPQDVVTLLVFLLVAGLTGLTAGRMRGEMDAAHGRAAALEVLSRASAELALAETVDQIADVAVRHLHDLAQGPTVALVPHETGLRPLASVPTGYILPAAEAEAADTALRRGRVQLAAAVGWNGSRLSFYPLRKGDAGGATDSNRAGAAEKVPATMAVIGHARLSSERRDQLWCEQAIAVVLRQTSEALHRIHLSDTAEAERRRDTTEGLRAALLASLSHDLRTPLATILGAVTTLRELGQTLPAASQTDLLIAIEEETGRLGRYVEKLLQLTRLQSGLGVNLAWVDAGDVAMAAVTRARRAWPSVQIQAEIPTLPMVRAEAGLLEQAVFNLIENAVKHGAGPVRLSATPLGQEVALIIGDQGAGLSPELAHWLSQDDAIRPPQSVGLGLPIVKGIARALGGRVSAQTPGAGPDMAASLSLYLPIPPKAVT